MNSKFKAQDILVLKDGTVEVSGAAMVSGCYCQ